MIYDKNRYYSLQPTVKIVINVKRRIGLVLECDNIRDAEFTHITRILLKN